jgi:acyl-CoA synthetase (AMP-forming)/AMP-acid ligase II
MVGIPMIGAIYCPLNPEYPNERLIELITTLKSQYLLTDTSNANRFNEMKAVKVYYIIIITHSLDDIICQCQWAEMMK